MLHIVTIDVWATKDSARQICEDIQGQVFGDFDDLKKAVKGIDITVYTLSEFMDAYNNEEVNEANTFMTYVQLERPL